MKIHNRRFPSQWEIIKNNVDFTNKKVIDLGCGYGDILYKCYQKNADCIGIEYDKNVFNHLTDRMLNLPILLKKFNLDDIHNKLSTTLFDVGICFSVLPYIDNPDDVLEWMQLHCDVSLIECQYDKDGPGISSIKNDNDMECWLLKFWESVKKIGETKVNGRNISRSIWKCK